MRAHIAYMCVRIHPYSYMYMYTYSAISILSECRALQASMSETVWYYMALAESDIVLLCPALSHALCCLLEAVYWQVGVEDGL